MDIPDPRIVRIVIPGAPGPPGPPGPPGEDGDLTPAAQELLDQTEAARDEAVAAAIEVEEDRAEVAANTELVFTNTSLTFTYRNEAEEFRDEAEIAAAAAQAGSEIYVDEPTGRAAKLDGQSFWVQPQVVDGPLLLYRRVNAATVSTLLYESPSFNQIMEYLALKADKSYLAFYGTPFVSDAFWCWGIRNPDGVVGLGLDLFGQTRANVVGMLKGTWFPTHSGYSNSNDYEVVARTAEGVFLYGITKPGVGHFGPQPLVRWHVELVGPEGARQVWLRAEHGRFRITFDDDADHTAVLNGIELSVMALKGGAVTTTIHYLNGTIG